MFFLSKKKQENIDQWFLEKNLHIFFREQKYKVEALQKPDSNTLLMILTKNGQKTLLLGRTGSVEVDIPTVRQALEAKLHYNCTKVLITINNKFTKEAQKLARIEEVELWDNKKTLKNLLPIHDKNKTPLNLPGAGELEKVLQEMTVTLGINSVNGENNKPT